MRNSNLAAVAALSAIRIPETLNLWQWMECYFIPVGSARAAEFRIDITPWLREPAEWVDNGVTTRETLVMPAQSGKSVIGEGAICKWIATGTGGDVQYNWENDEKGKLRYKKRARKTLRQCFPVLDMWPRSRGDEEKGLVIFSHLNFTMQGVRSTSNLESDSIKKQVNEEIHGWETGRLRFTFSVLKLDFGILNRDL